MIRHLLVAAALIAVPTAAGAQWVEGQHYRALSNPQPPEDSGRIEVAEFFWYGCPSCYQLEPLIVEWDKNKPADVDFVRYAASLAQPWRVHARAFYTAESLGVTDQVHKALFDAIHQRRNPLADARAIGRVFQDAAGIDAEAFQRAFDGFGVESRLRRGDQLARRFQIAGVPTIIVNGKWITSPTMAQGYERVIAVIDHLVERERGAPSPAAESRDAPAEQPTRDTQAGQPERSPAGEAAPADGADDGGAAEMWWLWLIALVAVGAIVLVATRNKKQG